MKPAGREQIGEEGTVGEVRRRETEVRVGGVLRDGEIGITGVDIDRLGADEDDGIEVRFERVERVQQRRSCQYVEGIRFSRCLHFSSSNL